MARGGETKYDGQLTLKLESGDLSTFIRNAERSKSTKEIVLRELIAAFNRYCGDDRFPVISMLEIASPGYRVKAGRVIDASDAEIIDWMGDEDTVLRGAPLALHVLHAKSDEEFRSNALALARLISEAMSRPRRVDELKAAEEAAAYGATPPPPVERVPDPVVARAKKELAAKTPDPTHAAHKEAPTPPKR